MNEEQKVELIEWLREGLDSNVIQLGGYATRVEIDPAQVLREAARSGMNTVVVIGWQQPKDTEDRAEGDFYFASSSPDGRTTLWLLELAKTKLMEIGSHPDRFG